VCRNQLEHNCVDKMDPPPAPTFPGQSDCTLSPNLKAQGMRRCRYAGAILQGGEGTAEDVTGQSLSKHGSHHAAVSMRNLRKQVLLRGS